MASMIYTSTFDFAVRGTVDFDTDVFYAMLVTSSYTGDATTQDSHQYRSSATGAEVAAGAGYTTGGKAIACTVTKTTASNQIDIAFAQTAWTAPSGQNLVARGMIVYKYRAGAATADELILFNDFGSDQTASGGDLTVGVTTMRLTIPAPA